jgi:DNA gyrase subunit A
MAKDKDHKDESEGMSEQPVNSGHVLDVKVEEEMKKSYLDYSMSVIISRALPDVRDGLKPSQRRILLAMNDLSLTPGRQYRKCAKIAGDTSGNYHPHGEQVVYPTLVRLAQDFNMRYTLVEGQGNFGSVDGDPPAAMRYTEARMTHFAVELMADLEKNTVDFVSNYDETRQEPVVFPGKFPNLICNGSAGIAVGMSTNIPPHNVTEVVDALTALIDNPAVDVRDLCDIVTGPDFPTGGIICGRKGILDAYTTGRGLIIVRAQAHIEEDEKTERERIIVTEIPYQVNKTTLIEKIADLVKEKRVEAISDIRDESDREGMRLVIELKRGEMGTVVLNQLYQYTQLQESFGVIMLALVDGQPKVLTLKEMLQQFIRHRHEVIVRRTKFELAEAEDRAHILEGLKIALDNIDAVIETIKKSANPEVAQAALMEKFGLSERQAQAILQMRLQRLTGLERDKIEAEYRELLALIERLKSILASEALRMGIIKEELLEIQKKYGDARRTQIVDQSSDTFSIEDLIAEEDMIITISHYGYVKRIEMSAYRKQRRGGRGVKGLTMKEEDFVEHLLVASTHDYLLFFTNKGRCHWLKVHEIPMGGRLGKGKPIVNLLELEKDEAIRAYIPVRTFDDQHYLVMVTKQGTIKKTVLAAYGNPRKGGINAITLAEGDSLIEAKKTDGACDLILGTKLGQAIRFNEQKVRAIGRVSQGVKGIDLGEGDEVVGMVAVKDDGVHTLLVVTEHGFGKRTEIGDYRVTGRGGKGVINVKTSERNGQVMALLEVAPDDDLMIITKNGIVIRMPVENVKVIGRATQGVTLIDVDEGDWVIDITRIPNKEEDEGNAPRPDQPAPTGDAAKVTLTMEKGEDDADADAEGDGETAADAGQEEKADTSTSLSASGQRHPAAPLGAVSGAAALSEEKKTEDEQLTESMGDKVAAQTDDEGAAALRAAAEGETGTEEKAPKKGKKQKAKDEVKKTEDQQKKAEAPSAPEPEATTETAPTPESKPEPASAVPPAEPVSASSSVETAAVPTEKPGHEQFDHTADVGVKVQGDCLEELFENSAQAMFEIMADTHKVLAKKDWSLSVTGEDNESLLVNFLNEARALAEKNNVVLKRCRVREVEDLTVRAHVSGEPFDPAKHERKAEIKTTTYHQLKIQERGGVWMTKIVFDV